MNLKRRFRQPVINTLKHYPFGVLANIKYRRPARKLKIIGVTGTDGKTTTVNMIYQILKQAGKRVSMISTINAVIGEKTYDTGFHVTSPDSFMVQKLIQEAVWSGSQYLVLEVTSHGLDQHRFLGISFEIGVITNITHEHLDYHRTLDRYRLAKAKLIKRSKISVLNYDDPNFNFLKTQALGRVVSFGMNKKANWNLANFNVKLQVLGSYNQYNALAAAAATANLGIDKKIIKLALSSFGSLPGRMEQLVNPGGAKIIVDFAHTPNGLEQALMALRKDTKGKLIAVFGAASERDILKRPIMGQIGAKLADIVILTDEDPRFEPSLKIIDEIARGAYQRKAKDGVNLFKEPDRYKAILKALEMASVRDTVGIFGKGHEKSMNYQGKEVDWSDQAAVIKALQWIKK